jgi:FkbM family methyltransferase
MSRNLAMLTVDEMLSESKTAAAERAQTEFDRQAGSFADRLVLFGLGQLGRSALAELCRHGVKPLALSDNNPKLWHQRLQDIEILPPAEAAERFGDNAAFIPAIWNMGHRQRETRDQLTSLGCSCIVNFGYLFWKYPEKLLPHYALDLPQHVLEESEQVRKAFELLADDRSRDEYAAQLRWRLHLDFDGLFPPVAGIQYFPRDVFSFSDNECFVDCGAYNGDTVISFLEEYHNKFDRIIALEPDPINYAAIQEYVDSLDGDIRGKIVLKPVAAADKRGTLSFEASGNSSSSSSSAGNVMVDCEPLDGLLANDHPTYVKMDIEGAELDALRGASHLIRRDLPLLAISAYHRQNHLWQVPLTIQSSCKGYSFFLRPHVADTWDLVCYAVPDNRLASQGA